MMMKSQARSKIQWKTTAHALSAKVRKGLLVQMTISDPDLISVLLQLAQHSLSLMTPSKFVTLNITDKLR